MNQYPEAFLYLLQGINFSLGDIRLNLQFAQFIIDAQNSNFLDKRSQPLFKKIMKTWATNVPQGLLSNDEIKGWVQELYNHRDQINETELQAEFKAFDQIYNSKFCKKCMPELD